MTSVQHSLLICVDEILLNSKFSKNYIITIEDKLENIKLQTQRQLSNTQT